LVAAALCSSSSLPKYERTPYGMVWSECAHEIEEGSTIETNEEGKTTIYQPSGSTLNFPSCPYPVIRNSRQDKNHKRDSPDDGWQVWTAYNNENNATFDAFLGTFNVPQNPPNWDSGTLYMFTGLQNDNWVPIPNEPQSPPQFDIIQPVLQYGYGPNGGGSYWVLSSWYVTVDENIFYSIPITVNAGDIIFGNMTRINSTSWFIGSYDTTKKQMGTITVVDPRLITQPWAYCTLEVYSIDNCTSDFPASALKFTNLALFDNGGKTPVTPQWEALNNMADHCGATATVLSPSAVTIQF